MDCAIDCKQYCQRPKACEFSKRARRQARSTVTTSSTWRAMPAWQARSSAGSTACMIWGRQMNEETRRAKLRASMQELGMTHYSQADINAAYNMSMAAMMLEKLSAEQRLAVFELWCTTCGGTGGMQCTCGATL